MRRPLLAAAVLVAACGSDDAPTIEVQPEATTTSAATADTTTTTVRPADLVTVTLQLSGGAEVPGPGSSGTGSAVLTYDGDELCSEIVIAGTGPIVAGHIHAGLEGQSGPIVIDLGHATDDPGTDERCVTIGAEGGVIFEDRAAYYLNLHTALFPDGALRAQLQ